MFGFLAGTRREALWSAGAAARDRPHLLPGTSMTSPPPSLPGMTRWKLTVADLWATSITTDGHPDELMRAYLTYRGALTAAAIRTVDPGSSASGPCTAPAAETRSPGSPSTVTPSRTPSPLPSSRHLA